MQLASFPLRPSLRHAAVRRGCPTALFSSQNWSASNVKALKDELRSRGLPVSGRKADLIARLEQFENSQTKTVPTSSQSSSVANLTRRNFSVSAIQQQSKPGKQELTPDPTPREGKVAFAAPKEESIDEQGSGVNTKFPQVAEENNQNASVPIISPNSKGKHSEHGSTQSPHIDTNTPSSITTTASPETLHGGGPSSVHHELAADEPSSHATGQGEENRGVGNFKRDSESVADKAEQGADKVKQGANDVKEKAGDLKDQAKAKVGEAQEKAGQLKDQAQETAADLKEQAQEKAGELKEKAKDKTKDMLEKAKQETENPDTSVYQKLENMSGVSIPSFSEAFKSDGKKFEPEDRDLNGEEVRGLYVLGGIFAVGYALGSFGKASKAKKGKAAH